MALRTVKNTLSVSTKYCQPLLLQTQVVLFHNTPCLEAWRSKGGGDNYSPTHFLDYNNKVYPPQEPGEEPRPAYVCHQRTNIKYSPWKMWYIACLVRGMPVDKAIKQLKFIPKKGAKDIREVIEEAKELAVKEHNVEFASNMWVAESMVGKGQVVKGMRRHARQRMAIVEYFHCHYFLRLEEGAPPKHYYANHPKQPHEMLEDWLQNMRKRKIINSI